VCFAAAAFVMAGAEEPSQKKRRGFVCKPILKPERRVQTPRFDQLIFAEAPTASMPGKLVELLGDQDMFIGIDVETHQLAPRNHSPGVVGRFGHWSADLGNGYTELLVVQLGWCCGRFGDGRPTVKQRLVKPDGFAIDPAATEKHNIPHTRAFAEGGQLAEVLREFLHDVTAASKEGGRLVAHNITFDGELISMEMQRCGLDEGRDTLHRLLREGVCTMSPAICHWVREMTGEDNVPYYARMGLKQLVQALLPARRKMLERHHEAGNDAEMHWLVCQDLWERARRQRLAAL
jgi:DNA polymerase III epsilon subunit-like protein